MEFGLKETPPLDILLILCSLLLFGVKTYCTLEWLCTNCTARQHTRVNTALITVARVSLQR